MIGYGVFQKPDMLRWYMEGIKENFPPDTVVRFYHEAAPVNGLEIFHTRVAADEILPGWDFAQDGGEQHILEHGVHRLLIQQFMAGECDVLIIPQDDNRFERPLIPDLEKLWAKYGTNLGWISGRDGYDFGYQNMVCSPFSDSNSTKQALPIGEYRERPMMNTGPVVYFRHVIEKVGLPDPDMAWYWWDEFSLRCHHAGLTNILLSMSCLHEKFGRCGSNPGLFNDQLVSDCLKKLNDRWRPVYGRNVI